MPLSFLALALLVQQLLQQYHDHVTAGHPGIKNMLHALAQDFWWPTMKAFIMGYVKGCAVCQSTKPNTVHAKIPLLPITSERGTLPFQVVAMDLITDLPESQGKDTILTIVDHDCSKAAIFIPCTKMITAEGLASLYAQHMFPHYGAPRKVISDRDTRLDAKFTRALCNVLGIMQNMSTAYHTHIDGQSEWANQSMEQFLCIYGNAQQNS